MAEAARLIHEEHLTIAETATRLGVHERTVKRWTAGLPARPSGPAPAGWGAALDAARTAESVTVVCPEHEPGGKVLAGHVSRNDGRVATERHYRATGHSVPMVFPAEQWDWMVRNAAGGGRAAG